VPFRSEEQREFLKRNKPALYKKWKRKYGDAYSTSLDEERALDNFVARIEGLAAGEVAAWGARQSRRKVAQSEPE
jgi:hypothetical protein